MIIKAAESRKDGSSGGLIDYVGRLLEYVNRTNLEEDNRPTTWSDNCISSDDLDLCKIEISNTQKQNRRTKKDRTYHLIISFSPEDKITPEMHRKIVSEVCESIGYGEHQRVSAIHLDTNNEHCHVVINKIHPETFNIHQPFQDHYKLGEIATQLQQKYKLTEIDHTPQKSTNKYTNGLNYSGIKSFNEWAKESVQKEIEEIIYNGGSWQNVSNHLAKYNMHVRKRGNGLVISHKEKPLYIKASSITRDFKKLGPFDPEKTISPDVENPMSYVRLPVTGTSPLWQKYTKINDTKKDIYTHFKKQKAQVYAVTRKETEKIWKDKELKGPDRKERSKAVKEAKQKRLLEIAAERKSELAKHKTGNWLDFLTDQYNTHGDLDALEQLKKSKIFRPKFKNNTAGVIKDDALFSKVDKAGNTYEEVGKEKIFFIDDVIKTQSDEIAVATRVLEIGVEKYKGPLIVNGSPEFIKAVKLAAVIKNVAIQVEGQDAEKQPENQRPEIER